MIRPQINPSFARGFSCAVFLSSRMGLDLVELVMETEEHFGVHLPDEECAQVRTVADLASLVASKLHPVTSSCQTSQTFYRVRRALVESGLSRESVRPQTPLATLDPGKRRQAWRKLQRFHSNPRLRVHTRQADTVGDLVRMITPTPLPNGPGDRIMAEHQILEEVRQITSEQLGIALERIHPASDFVKDLGAG